VYKKLDLLILMTIQFHILKKNFKKDLVVNQIKNLSQKNQNPLPHQKKIKRRKKKNDDKKKNKKDGKKKIEVDEDGNIIESLDDFEDISKRGNNIFDMKKSKKIKKKMIQKKMMMK